jgi:hypothetical protein
MSTAPTTDNAPVDVINGIVSAFFTGGEVAAEAFLTALDPALLANPLGQWIIDEGVGYIGQILSIAGQKFIDGIVIDVQTNSEKSTVLSTATALAIANASGDKSAIADAVSNLSAAYKAVINMDGWGTPK